MQGHREIVRSEPAARHFREEDGELAAGASRDLDEISIQTGLPIEVNMTDEPGGDPYNHTGRFRRSFR
jgi:hypothetical protein